MHSVQLRRNVRPVNGSAPAVAPGSVRRLSPARTVFYLFRSGSDGQAFARFTDRADAIRTAWRTEGLGWQVTVLARSERPERRPGPWSPVYRTLTTTR